MEPQFREEDFLSCSGSRRFAREMVAASPFSDLDHAIRSARDIWFNKVDVKGWLESFAAHPEIGGTSKSISQWNKEEQSAALATATDYTMQELIEWNARYKEKFGFVFLICATGKGTPEILVELKIANCVVGQWASKGLIQANMKNSPESRWIRAKHVSPYFVEILDSWFT